MTLLPPLKAYVDALPVCIEPERLQVLTLLIEYIERNVRVDLPVKLVFICTHNSRRSHLAQIWAMVAATYYSISIAAYSGGTEETAFNPRAAAAIERAGFEVEMPEGENPRYSVLYSVDEPSIECFSKLYDDPHNPKQNFAAVITCDHADMNCPLIPGATRVPVWYEDPKVADGTAEESLIYDERTRQIAAEMFFVFRSVRDLFADV